MTFRKLQSQIRNSFYLPYDGEDETHLLKSSASFCPLLNKTTYNSAAAQVCSAEIFILYKFEEEHFKPIFLRREMMYLRICGSKSTKIGPANSKKIGFANPQIATLAKSPLIKDIFQSANLRICDLRNLFLDRPPLAFSVCQFVPCFSCMSVYPSWGN